MATRIACTLSAQKPKPAGFKGGNNTALTAFVSIISANSKPENSGVDGSIPSLVPFIINSLQEIKHKPPTREAFSRFGKHFFFNNMSALVYGRVLVARSSHKLRGIIKTFGRAFLPSALNRGLGLNIKP